MRDSAVIFIAVGTPQGEDGSADLKHVLGVAGEIAKAMNGYKVIVDKSTVPVGTSEKVREVIRRATTHPFSVVSNPEFLKQGAAIDDFMKPDRVVIGAEDARAQELMLELYSPFTRTGAPIMVMDCASAELAEIRGQRDAGVADLVHERSGQRLRARRRRRRSGAEGHWLRSPHRHRVPVSRRRLRRQLLSQGRPGDDSLRLRQETTSSRSSRPSRTVNALQKTRLFAKIKKHFGSLKGKTVAVWGLAFKPKTDDMREAPAIPLIEALLAAGATVQAHDPEAMKVARGIFGSKITYASNNYDALKGADCLAIVTEWNEFRRPDFERMRSLMRSPVIFDGRNLFTPDQMKQSGFTYYSIGRN